MANDWEAFKFLVGDWRGGNEGQPAQGQGSFSFGFELEQNILVRKSRTEYPAAAGRESFVHEDWIIFYVEFTGLKRAIYFDNEGHVIHYEIKLSPDQETIILESDPAPSMPQFRFTYRRTGADTLEASFEIAPPGQPGAFNMYVKGPAMRIGAP